jgi:hypothetical protein
MRNRIAPLFVGGSILVPAISFFSFFTFTLPEAGSAAPAPAAGAPTVRSIRGKCGMCHREIAQEWLNSLHSQAFRDVHFTAEAEKVADAESKCFTCHAPDAVRAKGLGQTPGFRTDLREVGVDCQVCHVDLKGRVHAPFRSGSSPHDVESDPQHRTEALCASCHEAFGTASEFKQSDFAKEGQTCATCHMPRVTRPVATGGKARPTAQHIWRGGSDPEMLAKAVKMVANVEAGGKVITKVTNAGAGHKFPTGIEYHQAMVVVTVTDASGKEVFSKRELLADQRKSGGTDTRLNPGETRTVTIDTGVAAGSFTTRLLYKRMPDVPDAEAMVAATATAKL